MPSRPQPRLPKYRHYKPKDLAVVRIDGRDVYLGRYDSPESREKYRRVLADWLPAARPRRRAAAGRCRGSDGQRTHPGVPGARRRLLPPRDGRPTGELENFRHALRPLKQLYGLTPAQDFGPKALKAVRQAMIDVGALPQRVNQRISKIVRVFKWGVENELVPPGVHHGLKAVSGLRKGRTAVKETEPVRPVPEAFVDAIEPYVIPPIWAMIEIQRLTGMRPGEVDDHAHGRPGHVGPSLALHPAPSQDRAP